MEYNELAPRESVEKTVAAAIPNGFNAQFVETTAEAMEVIKKLIPGSSEVMTGASRTLDEIGFTELLISGNHPWKNLKAAIAAEIDPAKQHELRKQSALSQFFLGSVHAITEDGKTIIASATGSQLAPYAYTSENIIWVAGAQKIVPTLQDAMDRIEKYVFPLENQRMKDAGYPGSSLAKVLIYNKEAMPNRKIHLIIVNQKLGF